MEVGFEKTLVFLIFIFLGMLLKIKFKSQTGNQRNQKDHSKPRTPCDHFYCIVGNQSGGKSRVVATNGNSIKRASFCNFTFFAPNRWG